QFHDLQKAVPRVSITNTNSENSDYTNYTANNKNCYLIFSNSYGHNEDCYYGTCLTKCTNCTDTINVSDCQYCFDLNDCINCYKLISSRDCYDCSESYFLADCKRCQNCIGCKGIRDKQYYIFNKQYSKENYHKFLQEAGLGTYSGYMKLKTQFSKFDQKMPQPYSRQKNCENCTGDHIENSQNCKFCFDTHNTQDCAYMQFSVENNKDCYDNSNSGGSVACHENHSMVGGTNCSFNNLTWWGIHDLYYCELCFNNAGNLFGCIGLRQKQYCILNKQYSKEDYEKLVPKIIEHMTKTGEWGEFFPMNISHFGYNETVANEYFLLQKAEALKLGAQWQEEDTLSSYRGPIIKVPDDIKQVDDRITKQILTCGDCGKNYQIIAQELKFYKQMELPIPLKCNNCRHKDRMILRNPRKLWNRTCAKCSAEIQTSYAPNRPEIVYCEKCYLKEVY
ncbi:hypothetical protein KJ835_04295, partial [Patescibacteria group bacterium]|nr:hypothetical protein [Patescibacteria group bacterium]